MLSLRRIQGACSQRATLRSPSTVRRVNARRFRSSEGPVATRTALRDYCYYSEYTEADELAEEERALKAMMEQQQLESMVELLESQMQQLLAQKKQLLALASQLDTQPKQLDTLMGRLDTLTLRLETLNQQLKTLDKYKKARPVAKSKFF